MNEFVDRDDHAVVSLIVVTYNNERDIGNLIADIRVATQQKIRLIVVDNQSADSTLAVARSHPDVIVVESPANVGYAAGINLGMSYVGDCDYLLILNPDVSIRPNTIARMISAAKDQQVGAVVPLFLDERGTVCPSIRREPSILRSLCDSVLTARFASRIGLPSESDFRAKTYRRQRYIDWATGAAILLPVDVAREVGRWDESFFLYSDEVDYFRRIRARNLRIKFEPSAVVMHRGGGSGTSPELVALTTINRVRYVEIYHGHFYANLFRMTVLFGHGVRAFKRRHRYLFFIVANRSKWSELPTSVQ